MGQNIKSGPSKICGRQLLKNFTWSTLEYFAPNKNTFFYEARHLFFWAKINIFLFLEKYFFKIPKNSIASRFFLPSQILKNVDMPLQNPRHLLTAEWNFDCCNILFGMVCSTPQTSSSVRVDRSSPNFVWSQVMHVGM